MISENCPSNFWECVFQLGLHHCPQGATDGRRHEKGLGGLALIGLDSRYSMENTDLLDCHWRRNDCRCPGEHNSIVSSTRTAGLARRRPCIFFLISLIIYLFRAAELAAAQAALATAFASRPSYVNPLLTSFAELIIPMATLHLPREQLHQRKQFRRCKFVGPGALTLLGGTIVRCSFKESGHVLTVPDHTMLTGVTVFEGCTIEDCEFIAVTIIIPRSMASQLAEGIPGVQIAY